MYYDMCRQLEGLLLYDNNQNSFLFKKQNKIVALCSILMYMCMMEVQGRYRRITSAQKPCRNECKEKLMIRKTEKNTKYGQTASYCDGWTDA